MTAEGRVEEGKRAMCRGLSCCGVSRRRKMERNGKEERYMAANYAYAGYVWRSPGHGSVVAGCEGLASVKG